MLFLEQNNNITNDKQDKVVLQDTQGCAPRPCSPVDMSTPLTQEFRARYAVVECSIFTSFTDIGSAVAAVIAET